MNTNTNNAVLDPKRGRIAFWNILACMFAGLAAFTLIRGGQDAVAYIACAILAAMMLLCLLARFSVEHPESFKRDFTINQLKVLNCHDGEATDQHCESIESSNPATGLSMLGTVDTGGNPYGVDLDSENWHRSSLD